MFDSSEINELQLEIEKPCIILLQDIEIIKAKIEYFINSSSDIKDYIERMKKLYGISSGNSSLLGLKGMNKVLKEQKNKLNKQFKNKSKKTKNDNFIYPTLSESELMYERLTKITDVIRGIQRMYAESSDINTAHQQAKTKYTQIKADDQKQNIILPNITFN
ncbi:hypothetical protein PA0224 [Candidatus Phytoplasma australiense]|uniref:Uncharacterized protein n=1 Tax=Phytoplasma australiense TaxID=59748 RepID=B1V9C7_PHYAS|nr:hypothetical protein PA0224 [Candidatus Phytoplasma australiense]